MPRIARRDSISNFYHVIVQGINREYIFDIDFNGNGDGSDFHKRNINKKQNSTNKYKIMW